jgi:hypothetical protein
MKTSGIAVTRRFLANRRRRRSGDRVAPAVALALAFAWHNVARADDRPAPDVPNVVASDPVRLQFPITAVDGGQVFQEMPPDPIPGEPHRYVVASWQTYECAAPWSLADPDKSMPASCTQLQAPVADDTRKQFRFGPESIKNETPWKRNYYGSFSVVRVNGGSDLLSINHGENKGKKDSHAPANQGLAFPNSIAPNMQNYGGTVSGLCLEVNGCYFAFTGASWMPLRTKSDPQGDKLTDYGPIVWPSVGYVSADGLTKYASGPRSPTAIVKDSQVYVFYVDTRFTNGRDGRAKDDTGDRRSGLKLMRATVRPPEFPRFEVYFNGRFSEPALPGGFSKDRLFDFISTEGPRATPLFGQPDRGSTETIEFTAVKIAGADLYLGAEQYEDYQIEGASACRGKSSLALRVSRDLIHWSPRHDIYGCLTRREFKMWFPRFIDQAGQTTTEIDPRGFKILGTANYERDASGLHLYSMDMSLDHIAD